MIRYGSDGKTGMLDSFGYSYIQIIKEKGETQWKTQKSAIYMI